MRGLKRFLYDRRRTIGAFGLFGALNALLLALYRLPVQAALYPTLLCAVLGAIFLGVEYLRVRRTHEALERLLGMSASMMEDVLPAPEGQLEEDYQALAESLRRETANLRESMGRRYRESVEYYTLWVHQIKTPISAMRLLLQNEDTQQSRCLRAELSRVERYVEMVLTYLRLDADDTDYVFRTCDLDALIRQAVRRFSGEFIGRKIRLEYAGVHEQLVTDEKWFSFVLEQLLSNALKYNREGGCIRIYLEEPKTLCVEDTGIGIAPEDLPRIFEQGYTGSNGRTSRKASGIGLYLCRRICGKLNIGISASSRLDEGTVIRLNLSQYQLKKE